MLDRRTLCRRAAMTAFGMAGVSLPLPTAAAPATPVPTPAPDALTSLLRLAPADAVAETPDVMAFATFADLAAQFAALDLGVPDPADAAALTRWLGAVRPLGLQGVLADAMTIPDVHQTWNATFGFELTRIAQYLVLSATSDTQSVLIRGKFDPDKVRAALVRSGYQDAGDGLFAFSVSPGDDPDEGCYDFGNPVCRLGFGGLNNATVLPDGTLVFSFTGDRVRAIQAAADGSAATLADRPDIAALIGAGLPPLAAAWFMPGTWLHQFQEVGVNPSNPNVPTQAVPAIERAATQIAEQATLPPVATALLGATPGGPLAPAKRDASPVPVPGAPAARVELALVFGSAVEANTAAPVVGARLASQQSLSLRRPYAELFPTRSVRVADDGPVLLVELESGPDVPAGIGFRLASSRDLSFAGW